MIEIPADAPVLFINPDDVPVMVTESFPTESGDVELSLEFHLNEECNFYTCNIFNNDNVLLSSGKVVYGVDLFAVAKASMGLSKQLLPVDLNRELAGQTISNPVINKDNFGRSIFLVLI